ncbi:hypothetical protein [Acinetobacter sp. LA-1]|uniref:hypothetical protein n=1 Tax=Acinetobacter sp. LA-1 TaxID=3438431 RepID=UPI003F3BD4F3
MSTRLMLCIALGIQSAFTLTHAANDLEKWNSEVGRTVRQTHSDKLAQTTYTEISSKNVTVSQDMKTVYPQIETSAQVAGSKTRVVAEAKLVVDKDKVWRDWNKKLSKFGKGTAAGLAAGAIVQGIVDGVGWIIDEGGKIKRPIQYSPNDEEYNKYTSQYKYRPINSQYNGGYSYSLENACKSYLTFLNGPSGKDTYVSSSGISCTYKNASSGNWSTNVGKYTNGDYNPSALPQTTVVSEEEKERVLKELLNDPKYADLANKMIGNTYTIGSDNPEPDPNIVNDIKDAQKGTLKSDDPKGDGRTRTDPKIDTGTQGQADTTPKADPNPNPNPNPDPGTTPTPNPNPNPNNGSTTIFELPPFCDYAAIVCDWIDWTKEKPEEEEPEEEEQINDKGIFDREFDIKFDFEKNCPPDYVFNFETKYIAGSYRFTFNWLCIFFNGIGYPLVFLSHCLGAWIFYEIAVRRGNQGG